MAVLRILAEAQPAGGRLQHERCLVVAELFADFERLDLEPAMI